MIPLHQNWKFGISAIADSSLRSISYVTHGTEYYQGGLAD